MSAALERQAAMFGCTVEQVRAQHEANLRQLRGMLEQAERTGRKVRGFSADYLRDSIERKAALLGVQP